MKAQVYHYYQNGKPALTMPSHAPNVWEGRAPGEEYRLVATIEDCSGLDSAYELTNTIDKAWWENDGVKFEVKDAYGARSTSVGDVIVLDGRVNVVDMVGFKYLPKQ